MFPAGISTPALTNLTHGWEFRYGGNNRRDTVLRRIYVYVYNGQPEIRRLEDSGDVRFEGEARQTVYVLPSTGSTATS